MKCTGLKEKCEWPEVEGSSLVVDKGKGKVKEQGVVIHREAVKNGRRRRQQRLSLTMMRLWRWQVHLVRGPDSTPDLSWSGWTS